MCVNEQKRDLLITSRSKVYSSSQDDQIRDDREQLREDKQILGIY